MPSKRTPARVRYEREWRARYRAGLYEKGLTANGTPRKARSVKVAAVKPDSCASCGRSITQPRTSLRLYCGDRCRSRAFYAAHPEYGWVPGTPVEPMPMSYTGHAVFDEARKAARMTVNTAYSVDWGQNDILGEATLAILEGRDPEAAVRALRAAEKGLDRRRTWYADIGTDNDGHLWAVRDLDAEGA